MSVHSTAVVDPKAELDSTVEVGPYCIVGPHVRVGAGTRIGPHTVLTGHTTLGENNHIHGSATLGGHPQDKKNTTLNPTELRIGNSNTIREYCTINTGTVQDGGLTSIGDDNWIMAYVHIAHDCHVGSHTILANCVQLGGHVEIGDWAILGGMTGVHQFLRLGAHSMTAFQTKLTQDLPPFVMGAGHPASASGINSEGLKRRGFSADSISQIKHAYKTLYRQGLSLEEAIAAIRQQTADADPQTRPYLQWFTEFIHQAERGIVR